MISEKIRTMGGKVVMSLEQDTGIKCDSIDDSSKKGWKTHEIQAR